eukprot:CAMPEP_0202447214 /NCGR_PEP_ID=MMETSP1360-20130828/5909_1 /ASSEMBLY_ACC=CAM_ASM_000848 /TAXON_ID=515479 /ORGANISM="Licmophora paradoxa, Strain CCMP2313" /LENGTH=67 /DNA_ID=CAMNT_0049064161 /DNA_START=762 /DNA_END=965 /DNA_ORIENTATION=+
MDAEIRAVRTSKSILDKMHVTKGILQPIMADGATFSAFATNGNEERNSRNWQTVLATVATVAVTTIV